MTPGSSRLTTFARLTVGAAMAVWATAAAAQQLPTSEETAVQVQANVNAAQNQGQVQQLSSEPGDTYWSTVGGWEGDSHATGYGFFGPSFNKPLRPNLALTGGINGNYTYYEFENSDGYVRVRKPGAKAKIGLRFGDENNFGINAGPSFKQRFRTTTLDNGQRVSDDGIEVGLSVGANLWLNPTDRSNIHGILSRDTDDGYTWGRIGVKQQITNHNWRDKFAHFLGAEYIGQGNEDIHSQQFGGFVEFTHAPSTTSIMLRSGYKRSTFDIGDDKTGPYFAVSFYRRMN